MIKATPAQLQAMRAAGIPWDPENPPTFEEAARLLREALDPLERIKRDIEASGGTDVRVEVDSADPTLAHFRYTVPKMPIYSQRFRLDGYPMKHEAIEKPWPDGLGGAASIATLPDGSTVALPAGTMLREMTEQPTPIDHAFEARSSIGVGSVLCARCGKAKSAHEGRARPEADPRDFGTVAPRAPGFFNEADVRAADALSQARSLLQRVRPMLNSHHAVFVRAEEAGVFAEIDAFLAGLPVTSSPMTAALKERVIEAACAFVATGGQDPDFGTPETDALWEAVNALRAKAASRPVAVTVERVENVEQAERLMPSAAAVMREHSPIDPATVEHIAPETPPVDPREALEEAERRYLRARGWRQVDDRWALSETASTFGQFGAVREQKMRDDFAAGRYP